MILPPHTRISHRCSNSYIFQSHLSRVKAHSHAFSFCVKSLRLRLSGFPSGTNIMFGRKRVHMLLFRLCVAKSLRHSRKWIAQKVFLTQKLLRENGLIHNLIQSSCKRVAQFSRDFPVKTAKMPKKIRRLTKKQLIQYEYWWRRRRQTQMLMLGLFTNVGRLWMKEMLAVRSKEGEISTLWKHLMANEDEFFEYLRMGFHDFHVLLSLVGPRIEKEEGCGRETISARDRLVVTLRYDSFCIFKVRNIMFGRNFLNIHPICF